MSYRNDVRKTLTTLFASWPNWDVLCPCLLVYNDFCINCYNKADSTNEIYKAVSYCFRGVPITIRTMVYRNHWLRVVNRFRICLMRNLGSLYLDDSIYTIRIKCCKPILHLSNEEFGINFSKNMKIENIKDK